MKMALALNANNRLASLDHLKRLGALHVCIMLHVGAAFLLFGTQGLRAQSCSSVNPGCFVQYKVTGTNHDKCGFDEFEMATPPRDRHYHHQKTVADYENQSDTYDTNSYDNNYGDCEDVVYAGGVGEKHLLSIKNVTEDEWQNGMFCDPTNIFSGFSTYHDETQDTRTNWHVCGDPYCTYTTKYSYSLTDDDADIAYVPCDGNWGWYWVGQYNNNTDTIKTPGCGGGDYVETTSSNNRNQNN
jgi:hypothetical protein